MHSFFATISRMKYIERWALMRSSRPENLSEHALEVAAKLENGEDLKPADIEILEEHGFDFNEYHNYWDFGPTASYKGLLQDTLTDAAWIDWIRWRDDLTPEGTTQRPMPDGYEPYVPEG